MTLSRLIILTKQEIRKIASNRLYPLSLFLVFAVTLMVFLFVRNSPELAGNGYHCIAQCLYWNILFSSLFTLILSSQLIAGEMTLGTMKNLLLCPLRRVELFLAKICGLAFLVLSFFLFSGILALVAGSLCGFSHMPEGPYARNEIVNQLWISFLVVLFPLFSSGALGLLFSTLIDNSPLAMAVSILFFAPLFALSSFFRGEGLSILLFPCYLDRMLREACNVSLQISELSKYQAEMLPYLTLCIPFLFSLAFLLLGAGLFQKKNILV